MADDDFSKLLQQAEQLTTEIEGNEELPRVERSLGQVLEASQELYSRVIQSGANDIQAYEYVGILTYPLVFYYLFSSYLCIPFQASFVWLKRY